MLIAAKRSGRKGVWRKSVRVDSSSFQAVIGNSRRPCATNDSAVLRYLGLSLLRPSPWGDEKTNKIAASVALMSATASEIVEAERIVWVFIADREEVAANLQRMKSSIGRRLWPRHSP